MTKATNYENILNCLQQIDFEKKLSSSEESLLFETLIKAGVQQFKKDTNKKKECAYCKRKNKIHVDINPYIHEISGKINFQWLCDECKSELNEEI